LDTIRNPQDLHELSQGQLEELADEVRSFLISNVSQTGGHLGPNLGVVELTLAVHRIFDSPRDSIVFDTGHQSYVHKLLTGRQDFSTLRQQGGMSGYPSRAESEHDIVESSHASSSLSWADGISRARQLTGEGDRYVVAVVGDGALTGGMAWEAINNIAADKRRRVVIVVNDSAAPMRPRLAASLTTSPRFAPPSTPSAPPRPTKERSTGGSGGCRTAAPWGSSPTRACMPSKRASRTGGRRRGCSRTSA
jgi:1-deoxy-D-xylulose-5-phosphate synthase